MSWVLVTGNENKWREAQRVLGRRLERVALDLPEIQAPTTREVAMEKAKAAYAALARPVIVEDAGVELAALGGFPGPFIKFWEKLGGLPSICRALDGAPSRAASAVCVLAFADAAGVRAVEGRVQGSISASPRGRNGFGWDAIFIPEQAGRTFAEMTAAEKDAISHRRRAWEALRSAGLA
jgi:non-canonical purine NTP pyrophosphatase (RdgB/HAM1 family)